MVVVDCIVNEQTGGDFEGLIPTVERSYLYRRFFSIAQTGFVHYLSTVSILAHAENLYVCFLL